MEVIRINEYSRHRPANVLFNVYVLAIFFMGYSGMAYPAYPMTVAVLVLFANRLRYDGFDALTVGLILIFSILKLFDGEISSSLMSLKYFFGFIVFYLLFRQNLKDLKINFNLLLIAISIMLMIEAVLINTILPATHWHNFPQSAEEMASHMGKVLGIYQRPYGIGTNASITSTIILCLLHIRDKVCSLDLDSRASRFASVVSVMAVIISVSGTGFFLLVLYFSLRKLKWTRTTLTASCFLICLYVFFLVLPKGDLQQEWFYKISPEYIGELFQFKADQTYETYSSDYDLWDLLFGKKWLISNPVPLGGDFGLLNFIFYGGISAVLLYGLIVIKRLSKVNAIVMLILFAGAVHYAAIFSTPGQIIFAFCLALDEEKLKMYRNTL